MHNIHTDKFQVLDSLFFKFLLDLVFSCVFTEKSKKITSLKYHFNYISVYLLSDIGFTSNNLIEYSCLFVKKIKLKTISIIIKPIDS